MKKIIFLLSIVLLLPVSANCASKPAKNSTNLEAPASGVVGEKIEVKMRTAESLPASSFYRVEIECPAKPEGAAVTGEMGYPSSELTFSKEGRYECIANLGIVTKSSCAGAQYKSLGDFDFAIDIAPR